MKYNENYAKNKVINDCKIDVKAGEFIGYVGKQGVFNTPEYVAAHTEVFTPNNMQDFITNAKDDGKEEKNYTQLPAKTVLRNYIKRGLLILETTKIKILDIKGDCIQLQTLENLVTVAKEQEKHQQRWYVDFALRTIDEETFRVDPLFGHEKKTYWVDKDNFKGVTIKKGDEIALPHTIWSAFLELPTNYIKKQEVIDKIVTVDISKKQRKFKEQKWYYVHCHYHNKANERIERKGWVKDSYCSEKFSAYNWDKFGFKAFCYEKNGATKDAFSRLYPIKGMNNYKETSKFIKEIISLIDENKDGKIQPEELQASYNKHELYNIFSKMVCLHKSEWSYEWEVIKSDTEKLIKYQNPNVPQQEIDEQVNKLREKYDALYDFWCKVGAFYNFNEVWYFHPFAWVEQMKRVFGKDFHVPIINPQVRGWYNKGTNLNKKSKIKGWNPYASMLINSQTTNRDVISYGKPQRSTGEHSGLDFYAPVGTPIYACVDGVIEYHQMYGAKAGFLTTLKGYYKDELYSFQYMHLMEIENNKFRFYNNYKKSTKVINDGWLDYNSLDSIHTDPLEGETYEMFYDKQKKILQIDKNLIDIKLAKSIYKEKKVKKGDIIGYTGSTGNSYQGKDKNHLHFSIKNSKGNRIDPYELLKEYINLDASGEDTHKKQDGITPSSEW